MLRKLLRLAVDAAKIEIQHLVTRKGVEATPPPTPKVEPKESRWSSSAFHVEVLKSTVCPDCQQTKRVGSYRCDECAAGKSATLSEQAPRKPRSKRASKKVVAS